MFTHIILHNGGIVLAVISNHYANSGEKNHLAFLRYAKSVFMHLCNVKVSNEHVLVTDQNWMLFPVLHNFCITLRLSIAFWMGFIAWEVSSMLQEAQGLSVSFAYV